MKGKVILAMCALSAFVLLGSRNLVCAQDNMAAEESVSPDEASENETDQSSVLEDGVYTAEFDTDSNMFHVNEACGGKGTLTVKDGKMTIHVSLISKSILNLFAGTAEDAQKDGAVILEPTTDSVTYSDGYTDEVYGFDIPVPAIDEEFDVALIGKKGKWYDHKVTVSNPVPAEDSEAESAEGATAEELKLEDGTYTAEVTLEGGTGKAAVKSPAEIIVKDGKATTILEWDSPNYDYMIVDGEKYTMMNKEGNSTFEIPVTEFDSKIEVTADTVAMSAPHEIDYTLRFDSSTIREEKETQKTGTKEQTEQKEKTLAGLTYDHSLDLEYATQFSVDYYEGGYALISIADDGEFLLVPEGKKVPEGLDEEITVIKKPVENIYLVATSAMDFFCALDGLDHISLAGTDADGWYIDEVREALENGSIVYAGKYSAPDYEQIVSRNCGLAIESTMIYHTPEVQDKLEQFGIPVLVEHSSYEEHPLGRTEWLKLYAVLLGKEEEAEQLFKEQADKLKSVENSENTGKTVAFFYINSVGAANVRKSSDYIAKMIELAGGKYIFDDLGGEDNALSTMNMQMEEFYAAAKDADYIIYNSTIDGELSTMDQLLSKSSLLEDFKAVKEGNVWCTEQNLFQEPMGLGTMIEDIHSMLTSEKTSLDTMTYMHKLK